MQSACQTQNFSNLATHFARGWQRCILNPDGGRDGSCDGIQQCAARSASKPTWKHKKQLLLSVYQYTSSECAAAERTSQSFHKFAPGWSTCFLQNPHATCLCAQGEPDVNTQLVLVDFLLQVCLKDPLRAFHLLSIRKSMLKHKLRRNPFRCRRTSGHGEPS